MMIAPHELADLRAAADRMKCTPGGFDAGSRVHVLLDAYEGQKEKDGKHKEAIEKLKKERDDLKDDKAELRREITKIQALTRNAPNGDTALERLEEIAVLAAEALVD